MNRACLFSCVLVCLPACAGEQTTTATESPPPPTTGETPPCVPDSPRQHAFLQSGACADVEGKDGKWIARTLFPDAPAEVGACTFRWSTTSSPDIEALRGRTNHMTPSCEPEGSTIAPRGTAVAVDAVGPGGVSAPTGVSGCDVCGVVHDRSAYVILPADKLDLRRMFVRTRDGMFKAFDLSTPSPTTQAFVVDLPPGAYVFGQVPLSKANPI